MPTASRLVPASRFLAAPALTLLAALILSGCSSLGETLQGDKVDYKSAAKGTSLDVPPDLTQLSRDTRYVVPGSAITASGYQVGQTTQSVTTAATTVGDVRIERAGNQRWLVVNRPADKLWGPTREFWQESGFLLAMDQENLGIMETDWAENRAKLPQDFIRATLGKLLDSLYSTGERDKFRTRLERTPTGGTEIYVSHRGMVETVTDSRTTGPVKSGDGTIWQPRPADPELEAEFLRRLMVKLGVSQEQSKALIASGTARQTARVAKVNNVPVVQIDEGFERAWRRVGLALDRTGFTVEDRDRTQGTYFVRYVEPTADKKEPGFFSKLFSSSSAGAAPLKYRIAVRSEGEATTVSVLNAQGTPEASANAQRIVQVIADDLK
ncbi:outer membrane protein assembly factor BamC [Polaromonas sp. SM01]|uniref:outer membrane protein assembly factor BamC n=1 Tax=Polaromonas sp. SM01 TaxID=3085630 RepID=UPI00298123F8|nr:outer membrane protein assembly factor BamC [Polaromonas sp. SM01]MDW5442977.1 outer membrane protein assembly factor BamC [Polaromonas sp. SM01]